MIESSTKVTAFFTPVQQIGTNNPNDSDSNKVGQDNTVMQTTSDAAAMPLSEPVSSCGNVETKKQISSVVLSDSGNAVSVLQEPIAGCSSYADRESSNAHIYKKKFLGQAQFDPVMREHLRKNQAKVVRDTYFSKDI